MWYAINGPEEELQQQKAAMRSALGYQNSYNKAELNVLRAYKAWEAAQKTGNAQQIAAAQQGLEGAREGAAIAAQYKPTLIKNADGTGILRTYDSNIQDWKDTNLTAQ